MSTALTTEIYDSLKDHKILCAATPEECIYDCWACVEIKSILEDAHVAHAVYVHHINNSDPLEPDMWCNATWESAGGLHSLGFNYMSEKRMDEYTKYMRKT